jgi:hypothetical protein
MLAALVFCVVVTETHAAEYEYCVSDKQRNCWFDANYEARMAMEDMMFDVCDFEATCMRLHGWRGPLYEDDRFKPKWIFRK